MKQPIRRQIIEANNIDTNRYTYTAVFDMNNIMKMASVDHKMNGDGKEYGIILTTLRLVGEVLRKKDFDYCIAAYDGEGSGVLRWQQYKDYKANRDKNYELHDPNMSDYMKGMINYSRKIISKSRENAQFEDDEAKFKRQKGIIQEILDNLCIRQYEFENVEGDDIISYYVKNKKGNEKVVIVSSDRDLTQLISDTVVVYNPRQKDFITKENAVNKLGILSENIVLEKMICGDTSDNIKGIKGVGEGTLRKLFPELMTEKLDLSFIKARSQELLDRRKEEKKKPLKSLENIIYGVTDGCQGNRVYEINEKIIDLSVPLLTDDAKNSMDEEFYAPMDIEDRSIKNIYRIVEDNKVNDILDESKFGNILEPFGRIVMMEKKRYELFKKESQL